MSHSSSGAMRPSGGGASPPKPEEHKPEERPRSARPAPAPRDAAQDQLQLLLMLATDWLKGDRSHAGQIQALVTSLSPQLPPTVVDVPHISQAGAVLNCTMGNWTSAPTSYAYQWALDDAHVGTDSASYSVQPEDVGKTATCSVTATNDAGSTVAPLSNALVVV